MGHHDREQPEKNGQVRPRRRSAPAEERSLAGGGGFLSREDLSNFLSIKPYLSEAGQTVIALLEEIHRTGGRLDQAALAKLLGIFGGGSQNLATLGPLLAGLAGGGGKLDAATLLPLLTSLTQTRAAQEPAAVEKEEVQEDT